MEFIHQSNLTRSSELPSLVLHSGSEEDAEAAAERLSAHRHGQPTATPEAQPASTLRGRGKRKDHGTGAGEGQEPSESPAPAAVDQASRQISSSGRISITAAHQPPLPGANGRSSPNKLNAGPGQHRRQPNGVPEVLQRQQAWASRRDLLFDGGAGASPATSVAGEHAVGRAANGTVTIGPRPATSRQPTANAAATSADTADFLAAKKFSGRLACR